jgi:hypothetical protein
MKGNGQLHSPAALPPGKEPRYPLDKRLSGPQSRSRRCGEEKSSLPGIERRFSGHQLCNLEILTELSRLEEWKEERAKKGNNRTTEQIKKGRKK